MVAAFVANRLKFYFLVVAVAAGRPELAVEVVIVRGNFGAWAVFSVCLLCCRCWLKVAGEGSGNLAFRVLVWRGVA